LKYIPHPRVPKLQFMDTPGFFDSKGKEEDDKIFKEIQNIFTKCPPQVIFVLMKFGSVFDGNILDALQKVKFLSNGKRIVFIFTFSNNMSVQIPTDLEKNLSKYSKDQPEVQAWKVLRDDYQAVITTILGIPQDDIFFLENGKNRTNLGKKQWDNLIEVVITSNEGMYGVGTVTAALSEAPAAQQSATFDNFLKDFSEWIKTFFAKLFTSSKKEKKKLHEIGRRYEARTVAKVKGGPITLPPLK